MDESLENATDNAAENEGSAGTLEDEGDILKKEIDELKDKYVRLVADFDNFRKRNAKERLDLIQTASKDVLSRLLPVLDDTERAEKQLQTAQDTAALREGVSLVFNKLRSTLQSAGLKPMESVGKDFNPEFHEAITEVPAPAPAMKGKVLDEVEKGYYLNDKIIRFAKVVVGK
jgi:molecular chaperone GrpE